MAKKLSVLFILLVFVLSACSSFKNAVGGCPDAEISWVDVVMINGIKYEGEDEGLSEGEAPEKGQKIGEVRYMLADNACSNHKLRNGDAAFLPVGTEIFEIAGYRSDFRVLAGNKVYQVSENKKAKTISELLDIEGKVKKMSLESDYDGSHVSDFTEQETVDFVKEFLSLKYAGYDKAHKKINSDNRVFLRIHLMDGSSFNFVYWPDENVLNLGAFGTEEMKEIVLGRKGIEE
ncbi:hypothetical protein V4V35_07480 [Bacillus infantis]|uniref:hypothetical protein n=1 Tax=Bacillus infantis TaxID=324767 RepID=UPI002FBE566A